MRAIGREDLAADPRYATMPGRAADRRPIEDAIAAWAATVDADEGLQTLEAADIPAGTSLTVADAFTDPHYAAREMVIAVDDPALGPVRMQGITPKLTVTPGSVRRGAPRLGEHNDDVYCGLLGLDRDALEQLRRAGTI
jgi:formyl-CoA transferase